MITVKQAKNKITISGHAGYGDFGNDIVCASVSSIAVTTVNAINKLDNEAIDFKTKDGFLEINIKKDERLVKILLNNMLDLFRELEMGYPENIEVK